MQMTRDTSPSGKRLDTATELAFDRTRAAYERTMMSWIRTSTSLITFGFSIYKFFQLEVPIERKQNHIIGPREFAFILVSIGLVSLVLATVEYHQDIRSLGTLYSGRKRSLTVIVAGLISVLGILALLSMVFRK